MSSTHGEIVDEPTIPAVREPIGLDGLAYGIDHLEAIIVFYIGDAHVHAAWVGPDAGISAPSAARGMRDAYRVSQGMLRGFGSIAPNVPPTDLADPLITLEMPDRTVILARVRSYVVSVIFDRGMPLGMAKLTAARIRESLDPELPYASTGIASSKPPPVLPPMRADLDEIQVRTLRFHSQGAAHVGAPAGAAGHDGSSAPSRQVEPRPQAPGAIRWSPSRPPPSRGTLADYERTRRLLAYLDTHAPEPHVARLRLALRAGITLVALDHPEALGADALVLLETAAEDILGLDRAELRSLP